MISGCSCYFIGIGQDWWFGRSTYSLVHFTLRVLVPLELSDSGLLDTLLVRGDVIFRTALLFDRPRGLIKYRNRLDTHFFVASALDVPSDDAPDVVSQSTS